MNHVQLIICRHQSFIGIKHSWHAAASNFKVDAIRRRGFRCTHNLGRVLKFTSSLEAHSSDRLHQRSGVRAIARVRGGAASWPSLAAVAEFGGVQECNLRRAWGARRGRTHLPLATAHGPEEKEFFYFRFLSTKVCDIENDKIHIA